MIRHFALLSALGLAAIATPAAAQDETAAPTKRAELLDSIDGNFKRIDSDGDGALSKSEIDTAQQRAVEATDANIGRRFEEQFNRLDTNKDGQLSLAEFKAAAPDAKLKANAADQALGRLDADKDGKITKAEFTGPVLANFDRMDANKDGTLTPEERRARRAPEGR